VFRDPQELVRLQYIADLKDYDIVWYERRYDDSFIAAVGTRYLAACKLHPELHEGQTQSLELAMALFLFSLCLQDNLALGRAGALYGRFRRLMADATRMERFWGSQSDSAASNAGTSLSHAERPPIDYRIAFQALAGSDTTPSTMALVASVTQEWCQELSRVRLEARQSDERDEGKPAGDALAAATKGQAGEQCGQPAGHPAGQLAGQSAGRASTARSFYIAQVRTAFSRQIEEALVKLSGGLSISLAKECGEPKLVTSERPLPRIASEGAARVLEERATGASGGRESKLPTPPVADPWARTAQRECEARSGAILQATVRLLPAICTCRPVSVASTYHLLHNIGEEATSSGSAAFPSAFPGGFHSRAREALEVYLHVFQENRTKKLQMEHFHCDRNGIEATTGEVTRLENDLSAFLTVHRLGELATAKDPRNIRPRILRLIRQGASWYLVVSPSFLYRLEGFREGKFMLLAVGNDVAPVRLARQARCSEAANLQHGRPIQ